MSKKDETREEIRGKERKPSGFRNAILRGDGKCSRRSATSIYKKEDI